jgi:hypothetical protein
MIERTDNMSKRYPRKPRRIKVIDDDCDRGVPGDGHNCAYALAARREDPELIDVEFTKTRAYYSYPNHTDCYVLPVSMQKEVVALDRGGRFAPGEYELKPYPKSARNKPVGKVRGSAGGAGKTHFIHITEKVRGVW